MTWKLKRNDNQDTIELPEDLQWIDEFAWNKIAQSPPVRTLTGANVIQQGTKKKGRSITLTGDWVWIVRADIATMRSWTDVPELTMTLTHYDGRTFKVIWRLHDSPAIEATPVHYETPEEGTEPYTATLKLITV